MKAEIELLASITYDRCCFWEDDALIASAYRQAQTMQVFGEQDALFVMFSNVRADRSEILQWAQTWGIAADTYDEWRELLRQMRRHVEAWESGKPIAMPLSSLSDLPAKISFASVGNGYKIQIVLQSLADLLFTQCALAISRGAKLQKCQVCDLPFLQFPPFTRASRIYCSRKCNTAAYRERQQQPELNHATPKKRKSTKKGTR